MRPRTLVVTRGETHSMSIIREIRKIYQERVESSKKCVNTTSLELTFGVPQGRIPRPTKRPVERGETDETFENDETRGVESLGRPTRRTRCWVLDRGLLFVLVSFPRRVNKGQRILGDRKQRITVQRTLGKKV